MSEPNQPRSLLVFAHADEAAAFHDVEHLVTGVGKVQAATELTRALTTSGASRVTVLGTAGMIDDAFELDTVYRIQRVLQHDFSLPSPVHELPLLTSESHQLASVPVATIATGDVFVTSNEQRVTLAAAGAGLVDMEIYAYAHVCARLGVELQAFKVPSDFADDETTQQSWDDIVHRKSEQLRVFADSHGLL